MSIKKARNSPTSSIYGKLQTSQPHSPNPSEGISCSVQLVVTRLIENDPGLKELNYENIDLTRKEKKKIFEALAQNTFVEMISFAKTDFDIEDAKSFAEAFSNTQNKSIKVLDLSETDIDTEALEIILKAPLNLESLFLNFCNLGDEAAKIIAEHASVRDIALIGTLIGNKGVDGILASNKEFTYATYSGLLTSVSGHKGLAEKFGQGQDESTTGNKYSK